MIQTTDAIKGLDVAIVLDDTERAILSSGVKQQWFDIMQRLMEDQVRKFNLKLINTDPAKKEDVIANHYLAKAVAQFYIGLMNRIESECQIDAYNDAKDGPPVNDTNIEELR